MRRMAPAHGTPFARTCVHARVGTRLSGRSFRRAFDFASLDLRLSRRLSLGERTNLEVIAEGFNVLDGANLQLPNKTLNPANPATLLTFGLPTAADSPRQIQFGLRFNF